MTVASSLSKVIYSGNGTTSTFAVPFRFVAEADLVLVLRDADGAETTLTLGTDYAVTGVGDDIGGAVALTATPAAGESLTVLRDPELVQEVDYQENDPFPAETHEAALDRLTMMAQANRERIGRALVLPVSSPTTGLTIPEPESGRVLAWNVAGDGLENGPTTGEVASAADNADRAIAARSASEAAQAAAETARDAAETAQAAAETARDEAEAIVAGRAEDIGYDPAASSLAATDVQAALDELAGEKAAASDIDALRNGLLAEAIRRAVGDGVDGREYLGDGWIDPLADADEVDAAASTGWDHETADGGYLRPIPAPTSAGLDLSALTFEDVAGGITAITVDVENASGHFDAVAGAKVQAGCRAVLGNGNTLTITGVTGDGTAENSVTFTGVSSTGVQGLSAIHGLQYADGALRLAGYQQETMIDAGAGTVIYTSGVSRATAAFDGVTDQTLTAAAANSGGDLGLGKDWGSGVARAVSKCVVYSTTDQGFNNSANPVLTLKLQGSDDNAAWVDLASETFTDITGQLVKTLVPASTTAYRYHRAFIGSLPNSGAMAEVEFYERQAARPIGQYYSAQGTIDAAQIAALSDAAVTSDADGQTIQAAISPDGGTTWMVPFNGTNLVLQSEDLTSGAWTKNSMTPAVSSQTAKNGMVQLTAMYPTTAAVGHSVYQIMTTEVGKTYVGSAYFLQREVKKIRMYLYAPDTGYVGTVAYFDLETGEWRPGFQGLSAELGDDGAWRLSVKGDAPTTSLGLFVSPCDDAWNHASAWSGVDRFYYGGVQLRQGTTPGEYVPTTDAPATGPMDWTEVSRSSPSGWRGISSLAAVTGFPALTGDVGVALALRTDDAADDPLVSAVAFDVDGQVADMDLRFMAFTAAAPDLARVALVLEAVDDVTLDTDLVAQVRRGTGDWVAADLEVDSTYDAASVLVVGDGDLSAGSGTSTVLRLTSANHKDFCVRAVGCTFKGGA